MNSVIPMISPDELHAKMQQGGAVHLVDVRSAAEYSAEHATGAIPIPVEKIDVELLRTRLGPGAGADEPVHLICAGGLRAGLAARKLRAQGVENIIVVEGGTKAWSKQRLPLRRFATGLSLERQTHIALGLIILTMLTKGALLHPLFYAVVGLLGMGLVFAGVTGSCRLSMLLGKMPWNRTLNGSVTSSA